ncbi:MAG: hypothetical protein KBF97_04840, partial [Bacteroidetes bacterium]|nr:hypothetical protein [Bacteroidota bacterium]
NADCRNDGITPEEILPGSRNYTWTVDTVYAPWNSFVDITGTSPVDLWTANPGDAERIFYHYNGTAWETDLIPRPFSPKSIYSVSVNDVWSGGLQGKIWHYNGTLWNENIQYIRDQSKSIVFEEIYAISPNDVYATGQYSADSGYFGIIVHYDGSAWKEVVIAKTRTIFSKIRKSNNGKLYLLGVTIEQFTESTYQLYEFDGSTLTKIRSGTQSDDQYGGILEIQGKVYCIIGYDFYDYVNGSFINIGRLSDAPEFLNVGFGRTTKDIFLGMRNGIAHYNGVNTEYMIRTEGNIFVRYGILFEKDVFMMGRDSKGNNLIYHGTLNE